MSSGSMPPTSAGGVAVLELEVESGCAGRIVSRDEAREIAAEAAARDGRGWRIRDVLDLSEIDGQAPRVHGVEDPTLARSWIGYLEIPHGRFSLAAGEVVVVAKAGGRVLYLGPANERG